MATSTIVPEPVDYTPPTPLRTVQATPATLRGLITGAQPGDLIQLAPGDYGALSFGYASYWPNATLSQPVQIVGAPLFTSKLHLSLQYQPYVILRDLAPVGISLNNSHHVTVANCDFKSTNNGIYLTADPQPGGYTFVNNRMTGITNPIVADSAGIKFQDGRDIGNNNYIAGNVITHYYDGMKMGTLFYKNTSQNLVIDRNFIYDCKDDGIEADGSHANARITNNVIGGTVQTLTAGISIAPGGPGPILVEGNSISGYGNLPLKFNTEVDEARLDSCEISKNTIIQTSTQDIGWYFAGPINKVKNLNIHSNTFRSRGGIYITEAIKFPGTLDRNWLWTTAEFPYSANAANPHGCQFRFFDGTNNKYYLTFADFQAGTGFELAGKYAEMIVEPVPIPGFPVEKLCRWKVTSPIVPVPPDEPITCKGTLILTFPSGIEKMMTLDGVEVQL